jgi:hypothetical protein
MADDKSASPFVKISGCVMGRVLALQADRTSYLVLGSLCFVCGVAYALARIFLVVEAFISRVFV